MANLRSGKRPPEVETAAEQLQQARAMRDSVGGQREAPGEALCQRLRERRGDRRRQGAVQARRRAREGIGRRRRDDENAGPRRRDSCGRGRCQGRAAGARAKRMAPRAARRRGARGGSRARHVLRRRRLGACRRSGGEPAASCQRQGALLRSRNRAGPAAARTKRERPPATAARRSRPRRSSSSPIARSSRPRCSTPRRTARSSSTSSKRSPRRRMPRSCIRASRST